MASSSSSLLFFAVVLLACLGLGASDCGNYSGSCRFVSFSGTNLNLECQRSSGWFWAPTRMDVANCVRVKDDGSLACRTLWIPYLRDAECKDIKFDSHLPLDRGTTLTATCDDSEGTPVTSSINLNTCLGNDNGNVQCCPSDIDQHQEVTGAFQS